MLLGVLAVYSSPKLFDGQWRLLGLDYAQLHSHRIDFALSELREHGAIPAWYPREQMGTPFWSNVQNFPFVPTRLLLLATGVANLYTLAIYLSLALSAAFTYAFARQIGIGRVGAATAGWTFACSGYFASRLLAGHFGILEAFPGLPVLLWTIEQMRAARAGRELASRTLALALISGSVMLGAHPQLPIYALLSASAYALWRLRRSRLACAAASIVLGIALGAFALYPMLKLIARSSRVLALDDPGNDVWMPYGRLLAFLFPWRDGAAALVSRPEGVVDFHGYANATFFWDTVCYVGWLPLVAVIALTAMAIRARRAPRGPAAFIAILGALALVLALPFAHTLLPSASFIVLRSPARLLYLVSFALALAAGALIERVLALLADRKAAKIAVTSALLALHAVDLGGHDRSFVQSTSGALAASASFDRWLRDTVGDGRVGMDEGLNLVANRRVDDVGFFDSISLASTYRGLLALSDMPATKNTQGLDGWELGLRALRACGTRALVTIRERRDCQLVNERDGLRLYTIRDPAPRVAAFALDSALFMAPSETERTLRDAAIDPAQTLILPASARSVLDRESAAALAPPHVTYQRATPDRFEITVDSTAPCWLRVLESIDVGWHATVDGKDAAIYPAHEMAMAVPVPAGKHAVALEFSTPGRREGAIGSAVAALFLAGVVTLAFRRAV
jgi:hypothetical protein